MQGRRAWFLSSSNNRVARFGAVQETVTDARHVEWKQRILGVHKEAWKSTNWLASGWMQRRRITRIDKGTTE
jgi:hypothetical protein